MCHRRIAAVLGFILSLVVLTGVQPLQSSQSASMPALDRGLVARISRAPDSPETRIRASIRSLNGPRQRLDSSGAAYVAGKLIVKFRDGTSPAVRQAALAARGVRAAAQPSSANFDVGTVDAGTDAEATARMLRGRPEVEYAQPAYRVYPRRFRPNDPLYPQQWNLPDIDMERAWDIQPNAGSTITVAVLDTGVAYTAMTKTYHAGPFRVTDAGDVEVGGTQGTLYPAL